MLNEPKTEAGDLEPEARDSPPMRSRFRAPRASRTVDSALNNGHEVHAAPSKDRRLHSYTVSHVWNFGAWGLEFGVIT
ncbi:Protein of unknown function [Pyronema omphalodes CBS 100304]|uniref:Uncharacterized protein n=1 Tax=Pyronema omphalodes (strain CBS 100304) TaxID=1076935 RepID=U4LTD3_PYROM|nr:Protein of unknown function [Pyronema omphalodes CBS 100304]